jgi:outer membrane protein OmpA-like peptidoglycan-associated protein
MFLMVHGSFFKLAPAAIAIVFALSAPVSAADCQALLDEFNHAIDNGRESDAQTLVDKISTSAECGRFQVASQRRLAALQLSAAQLLMARGRPVADFERLLDAADSSEVLWQASATMGEVRLGQRRFVDAAQAYDRAIEIVKNETLTLGPPTKAEIEGLVERSAQARLLAASGVDAGDNGKFVQTARDQRDGTLGGFYSRSVRGIVPRALPVPITFDYRTATFTRVGEEAARELIVALKEQRPARMILVGHTDARGSADFNLNLSRERATAVATFMKENGLAISIEATGKGSSEPMQLSEKLGLTQEEIYALNRRVEWRRE